MFSSCKIKIFKPFLQLLRKNFFRKNHFSLLFHQFPPYFMVSQSTGTYPILTTWHVQMTCVGKINVHIIYI